MHANVGLQPLGEYVYKHDAAISERDRLIQ